MNIWHLDIKRDEWINIFKGLDPSNHKKNPLPTLNFDSISSIEITT